ncbi:hypothetical protein L0Y69_02380 [bacterium]|nr:hypothetical protein [bacterium]
MKPYQSSFSPSNFVREEILKKGRITAKDETPAEMIERVVAALYSTERSFSSVVDAKKFAESIGQLMDERKVVFSTPVMTNAGRTEFHRPLSACTVPSISLRGDLSKVREMVNTYHQEAIGTGFNLDEVDDPVSMLLFLNEIAVKGAASSKEDRPVGNMGILNIDHPRIVEFITSKQTRRNMLWKFNISVNTPESFWFAVENDTRWTLRNGDVMYARELFQLMAQSAHICADPGIIFMERINRDNPVPAGGVYHGIAPCAEVGLVPGETCQFGYINIGAFCRNKNIDLDGIKKTTELMVRALDNCLEISIGAFSVRTSAEVVAGRRKIGVGVCGLADALIRLGIPYASDQGREFARDVVAFINYHSKLASHVLAKERGSFGAMRAQFGCKYTEEPDFLSVKYGNVDTQWVSTLEWKKLGLLIKSSKLLRNSSTIALPPTGRSALVIDASTGVEPIFSIVHPDKVSLLPVVREILGVDEKQERAIVKKGKLDESCNEAVRILLRTSTEIHPNDHLLMVAALQPVVDESISKTINLPQDATVELVERIYTQAYSLNLKGMTMYRDGSSRFQPRKL